MLAGSSIYGAWPCPVTMTKLHRTRQDAHEECMDIRYPPARDTRTKPQNVLTFVEGSGESENADSNRCPEQPALSSQVQRPSRARPSAFIFAIADGHTAALPVILPCTDFAWPRRSCSRLFESFDHANGFRWLASAKPGVPGLRSRISSRRHWWARRSAVVMTQRADDDKRSTAA